MNLQPIYKTALGPLLLAQGRRLRKTAVRLPEAQGARRGLIERSNSVELKLLFLGDSTMAGVGVENQTAALAFQTAHLIAGCLDRSVRWEMLGKNGVTVSRAVELIAARSYAPDVLITAMGANDVFAQTKPRAFIADYKALIEEIFTGREERFAVISGLPPMHIMAAVPQPLRWFFGRYARQLDRTIQSWISVEPDISFLSLQWAADRTKLSNDRFHPGADLYRSWAVLIAEQIVERFVGLVAVTDE